MYGKHVSRVEWIRHIPRAGLWEGGKSAALTEIIRDFRSMDTGHSMSSESLKVRTDRISLCQQSTIQICVRLIVDWVSFHRLGYKAKQGFCIFRTRVRRGNRKRPVHKGIINGKPKTQGVNELKFRRNLKSVAEERIGKRCGNLRVLNSYWITSDGMYKYYEVRVSSDSTIMLCRHKNSHDGFFDISLYRVHIAVRAMINT